MTVDTGPAFQAFGRLYAHVIAFEQFMRVALGEKDVESGRYAKMTEEQRAAHSNGVMRLNFGQLLDRIAGSFNLSDDEMLVFKDAKGFRHHLAHEFWTSNFIGLHSDEGIQILVEECEALELQFTVMTGLFFAVTGVDAASYVAWIKLCADDPTWRQDKRRLLDDCWRAHREAGHLQ